MQLGRTEVTDDQPLEQPTAPNMKSFSLNSEEAHELLCRKSNAWIANGALAREPRRWEPEIFVDPAGPLRQR